MMFRIICGSPQRRRGFTLTEIVVALGVLGLLAALLFPAFGKARESSRQNHCAGNLHDIYLATRQYREDFQGYPPTLETLLPAGSVVVATSGPGEPVAPTLGIDTTDQIDIKSAGTNNLTNGFIDEIDTVTVAPVSVGYLKTLDDVVCPSDRVQLNGFSSSYGAKIGSVWNFYGYDRIGFQRQSIPEAALRSNPSLPFHALRNPAKASLANRFAAPGTVVTHCIFHRTAASGLRNPYALGTSADGNQSAGASDLLLRLDGAAKRFDVSKFQGINADGSDNLWQRPTF